ncbi:MAG: hypothetical protein NUW22_12415 [Acidobacteria bacterium]|nr:hypothetical protein [Acidobacteriota bacterium]
MGTWSYEFAAVKAPAGLVFTSRAYFDRAISTLGDGEQVIVTVAKPVDKRSLQANRALWGPIYDQLIDGIAESAGYDKHDALGKEQMHEGLLMLFGGTVVDLVTKREVAKERSSRMSSARFSEFMEWIARYAADEHGVVVTLPGEQ